MRRRSRRAWRRCSPPCSPGPVLRAPTSRRTSTSAPCSSTTASRSGTTSGTRAATASSPTASSTTRSRRRSGSGCSRSRPSRPRRSPSPSLVWQEWGPRARWSSRTFAVVWAGIVLSAAFPFALGAALALLGLWALQARRPWRFAALAGLTAAASPIAFLLLVLVVVGLALGRRSDRWLQLAAGAGLLAVVLLEALLCACSPASGRYPFSGAELAAACAYCALSTAFAWRVEGAGAALGLPGLRGRLPDLLLRLIRCRREHRAPAVRGDPVSVLVLSLRNWRPLVPALVVLGLAISWNVTPLAASYVRAEDRRRRARGVLAAGDLVPARAPDALLPRRGGRHRRALGGAVPAAGRNPARARLVPPGRLPAERAALRRGSGRRSYLGWLRRLGVRYVVLTNARAGLQRARRGGARRAAGARRSGRSIADPRPDRLRGARRDADHHRARARG